MFLFTTIVQKFFQLEMYPQSKTTLTSFDNTVLERLFNKYFSVFLVNNNNDVIDIETNSFNCLKINGDFEVLIRYSVDMGCLISRLVKMKARIINEKIEYCGWTIINANLHAIISDNYNDAKKKNDDLQLLYNNMNYNIKIPVLEYIFFKENGSANRFAHYKLMSSMLNKMFSLKNKNNDNNKELYNKLSQEISAILFIYRNRNYLKGINDLGISFEGCDRNLTIEAIKYVEKLIKYNNYNNIYFKLYKLTVALDMICNIYINKMESSLYRNRSSYFAILTNSACYY